MPALGRSILLALGAVFLLSAANPVSADIYRYRDNKGVWHFTNIKSDKRYRLYMRSSRQRTSQYIKDYEGIIKQASSRFRVDPSLVKAVIKAESDFNHKAVSSKGAQGLMQLMPKTAEDMDVQDPFNPEENIFGGVRYLARLLERFESNTTLALAAYNAGPEKVADYNGVPPYQETRNFIKKVFLYYNRYKAGAGQ